LIGGQFCEASFYFQFPSALVSLLLPLTLAVAAAAAAAALSWKRRS